MDEIDAILRKFTDASTGSVHGATFIAVDDKGNDIYRQSFGYQKVDTENSPVLTPDTITWIASQTKLTSSVATMQIVERGLVGLDDDVRDILPQLRDLKVLTGFENEDTSETEATPDENQGPYSAKPPPKPKGNPIFEDLKGPITLRQLMTHTSGFAYDLGHPLLKKYSSWASRTENMFSGTIEGNLHPLVFQPGTSWEYGPGLDWACQVVEKLTGMGLDEYQQKYIWGPLGAKNTTFFPARRGLTPADIHEVAERSEMAGCQNLKSGSAPWKFDCRDALGGGGLYSTANDYIKLLAALLSGGGNLLSKDSVNELFRSQIGPQSVAAMRDFLIGTSLADTQGPTWTQTIDGWRDVMELGHCLCGVVNIEDVKGRRRKNTVNWSGLPNLIWFIDRESGVAATFFTQLMPVGDMQIRELLLELEKALYRIIDSR